MAISEGYKANFSVLCRVSKNNDLALVECSDKISGKPVMTVCAIGRENGEYVITPLAKMFDGNPYEEIDPPT